MLEDQTNGELELAKEFAAKVGKADDLQKQLDYLANYSDRETKCVLYHDFAPHSFGFDMMLRGKDGEWKRWYNGGLIFFGDGETGVGGPQYSVRIGGTSCGWSIHT